MGEKKKKKGRASPAQQEQPRPPQEAGQARMAARCVVVADLRAALPGEVSKDSTGCCGGGAVPSAGPLGC